MTEEKKNLTIIREDDGRISIQGDEETVAKASILIGESIVKEAEETGITEEQLDDLVDIAENLLSTEYKEVAKRFLETAERYSHSRATNWLATLQENPLISEAMDFRAAARGDDPCINLMQESYEMQAELWRKKIDAAEGKPIEGKVPTEDEILSVVPMEEFFETYKKAFAGDLEAMKTCREFCEKEADYWGARA